MRRLGFLLACASAASLAASGCIFIHSSSISDSLGRGSAVSAQAADVGYLRIIPPHDLTKTAASQLANQCQSGKLSDVQTELSVRDVFFIVQMYNVDASGVCL
jgi:hypothetical protein